MVQAAKATAVLIASHPGHDIVQMDCKGPAECSMPLMTPATMISYSDAAEMRVRSCLTLLLHSSA